MAMEVHPDKAEYFRLKCEAERSEIERKRLNVDLSDITSRLESQGAVEVFNGKITSTYFDAGLDFLAGFYNLAPEVLGTISNDANFHGFSRLREMVDDDGKTTIYFVETRIRDSGRLNMRIDYGGVLDDRNIFRYVQGVHRGAQGNPRQIEVKRRAAYILDDCPGLEFSIDNIIGVTDEEGISHTNLGIATYLEVEAISLELYLHGVSLVGATLEDFSDISAKGLIAAALERKVGPT